MQYMTSLAPPALTATAISIMATIIWVLGKGVSAIITHFCHHFSSEKQDVIFLSRLAPCCQGCCTTSLGWGGCSLLSALASLLLPLPTSYSTMLLSKGHLHEMVWMKSTFSGEKRWKKQVGNSRKETKKSQCQNSFGRPDCDREATGEKQGTKKRDESELVALLNRIVKLKYFSHCFDNILGWSCMAIPVKMYVEI